MESEDNFYKNLMDNLSDGVYFVDRDRRITYWNHGAERITGYTKEQVIGKRCMDNILIHVNDKGESLCLNHCPIVKSISDNSIQEAEVFLHHQNGSRVPVMVRTSPIQDSSGEVIGAVETFSDISRMMLERRRIQYFEANLMVDMLTGIPNRRYMDMKLTTHLVEYREYNLGFGVLFIDIDEFKSINDRLGHNVGDEVIKMVARTLNHNLRASDLIGRWGGEEFVGIFNNVNLQQLATIAEKLRMLVEKSHCDLHNDIIGVTISVGGTLAQPNDDIPNIIKRADQLMYQCKQEGRNRVAVSD